MPSQLKYVFAVLAVSSGFAQAATQTLTGTHFDVVYDDTTLGLFGAPTLIGDNLFFTPNAFKAESLNGSGVVSNNSTISKIQLLAKGDFRFEALNLAEFGDYKLSGAGSSVSVGGQLIAFDATNPMFTYTASNITVSGATPLNINDGQAHTWAATASIWDSSTSVFGQSGWLGDATHVYVTLENLLSATTMPGVVPSQAFVEKKFNGVAIAVSMVPEPTTWVSMLCGLAMLGSIVRRRRG